MPFGELLEQFRLDRAPVNLSRDRLDVPSLSGLVLVFSRTLVLLRVLGDDAHLDGYAVVRRGDLTRADWDTDALRRLVPAAEAVGRVDPVTREVRLADWHAAIGSAAAAMPVLTFSVEGTGDPVTAASRSVQLLKHLVVGEEVTADGAISGRFASPLAALTRMDFAGGSELDRGRVLGLD